MTGDRGKLAMDDPRKTQDQTTARAPTAYESEFERLYDQLHSLARRELGNSARTSLDTTSLLHEAFLKLGGNTPDFSNTGHMLAVAARAMRFVLVDHVRAQAADKRGGGMERVPLLTDLAVDSSPDLANLLEINRGLDALQKLEPRLVSVVECRYFGGMDFPEIALALGISERTAQRDWRRARAFLQTWFGEAT